MRINTLELYNAHDTSHQLIPYFVRLLYML